MELITEYISVIEGSGSEGALASVDLVEGAFVQYLKECGEIKDLSRAELAEVARLVPRPHDVGIDLTASAQDRCG